MTSCFIRNMFECSDVLVVCLVYVDATKLHFVGLILFKFTVVFKKYCNKNK